MQPSKRRCEFCEADYVVRFSRQARQRFCSVGCARRAEPKRDAVDRFWSKAAIGEAGACWPWTASGQASGYGSFYFAGRLDRAHRVAWLLTNGSIPNDRFVLHRCDNPKCVNPSHLFLGSARDNSLDMVAKGRHGEQKLTAMQAAAIRIDTRTGALIGAEYGISKSMVNQIKRGAAWAQEVLHAV